MTLVKGTRIFVKNIKSPLNIQQPMNKRFITPAILLFASSAAFAQMAGNSSYSQAADNYRQSVESVAKYKANANYNYQQNNQAYYAPSAIASAWINKDSVFELNVNALMNVKASSYVVLLGVSQAAETIDSCQRMIGAQIMRTLRRAGDLCARYDDRTLVAAVLGQTPDDVRHLVDQIADNVRQLGLHNPRGRSGRHIAVRPLLVGCPPGTQDDADALVTRALAEQRPGTRAPVAKAPASSRGSAAR